MRSNGRYRVVQHDKPERLAFDPRIMRAAKSRPWLKPALYLTWTAIGAVITWVIVTGAETVAGR